MKYAPQFFERLDEFHDKIGPLFYDAGRDAMVREEPGEIHPDVLDERALLYRAGVQALDERQNDRARFVAAQLALINNAERPWQPQHELPFPLRPYQSMALDKICESLVYRPSSNHLTHVAQEPDVEIEELFTKGTTAVSSTGSGKTVIMGALASRLRIGTQISEAFPEPLRALIVTGSGRASEQFAGLFGKDLFRRVSGILNITVCNGDRQDMQGSGVATTGAMFRRYFRHGYFKGEFFPILLADEIHKFTGRLILRTFVDHWRGPAVGFTATPAYKPKKDIRHVLPYTISHGSVLGDIKKRFINGVRLFTFIIEPPIATNVDTNSPAFKKRRRDLAETMRDNAVISFVVSRVKMGKQVWIPCEAGSKAAHAQYLAERISNQYIADGFGGVKPIDARAISVFQPPQEVRRNIRDYQHGKCQVITTVRTGIDSIDLDNVDVVAYARDVGSMLEHKQMDGRGLRKNPRHPITEYAEFLIPNLGAETERQIVSLWDSFGLGNIPIQQGYTIEAAFASELSRGKYVQYPTDLPEDLPSDLYAFAQAATGKLISEVLISADVPTREVPRHYIPLYYITAATGRSTTSAIKKLNGQFQSIDTWEVGRDGEDTFVRHYPPEALQYLLEKHPLPLRPSSTFKTCKGIATAYGWHREVVQKKIDSLDVALGAPGLAQDNNIYIYYSPEEIAIIKATLDAIPEQAEGDETATSLTDEFGYQGNYIYKDLKKHGITLVEKRRRPVPDTESQLMTTANFICKPESDTLRAEYYTTPLATAEDFTIDEIARFAGMAELRQNHAMIRANQHLITKKRCIESPLYIRDFLFFPAAAAIVKELHPITMPAHLITMAAVRRIIPQAHRESIAPFVAEYGYRIEEILLPFTQGRKVTCYPWAALQHLAEEFGHTEGVQPIPYKELPFSPRQVTAESKRVAHSVQQLYMPSKQLTDVPTTIDEIIDQMKQLIRRRQRLRNTFLSFGNRAEQWQYWTQKLQGQPISDTPTESSPNSPPRIQATTSQAAESAHANVTIQKWPELTITQIAEKAGVAAEEARHVAERLAPQYSTAKTLRHTTNGSTVYRGSYLDAILMVLIGRTAASIAQIIGRPEDIVAAYLSEHHAANLHGRYGLAAMQGAMTEFRRPPKDHVQLSVIATAMKISIEALSKLVLERRGRIDYFYTPANQKRAFLSPVNARLVGYVQL
jgi:superfamily II DNA or RNA helicase